MQNSPDGIAGCPGFDLVAVKYQQQGERPMLLDDLSFALQSFIQVDLANAVYLEPELAASRFARWGYQDFNYINNRGAQAYVISSNDEILVACRGTQRTDFRDLVRNIQVWPSVESGVGAVHRGFQVNANLLWPQIKVQIQRRPQCPVWFLGHSLGGAIAHLLALRMLHDADMHNPHRVTTFGSPRLMLMGSNLVCNNQLRYDRWVNHLDLVARLPSVFMGYRHQGQVHYINQWGNVTNWGLLHRSWDRFTGYLQAIFSTDLGFLESHRRENYLLALERYYLNVRMPEL